MTWVSLRTQKVYTRLSRAVQDQGGDVASSVEEMAHGHRVIKSFGRADHVFTGFDRRSVRLHDTAVERVRVQSSFWTFLEVIPSVTLIIVLALGALAVAQDRVTLGTLVAFTTLMMSLVWPVTSLGFLLSMTQDAMTAADRIAEVFDAEITINDGAVELDDVRGELVLRGRVVPLPGRRHRRPAPHRPAPGAGRDRRAGRRDRVGQDDLHQPRRPPLGRDRRPDHHRRRRRARPPARPAARAGGDGVRGPGAVLDVGAGEHRARPARRRSDADIDEAVEVAQAQFVHELPFGLDTRIGEQGMSLSGGQRQRLALARAVLASPAVLVLDDTLSALDIHTEALVEEALRRVLVGVTGIVVAHRASTVLLADRVALLQDGTITHVGTHTELLETVPAYRELLSAESEPSDELLEVAS